MPWTPPEKDVEVQEWKPPAGDIPVQANAKPWTPPAGDVPDEEPPSLDPVDILGRTVDRMKRGMSAVVDPVLKTAGKAVDTVEDIVPNAYNTLSQMTGGRFPGVNGRMEPWSNTIPATVKDFSTGVARDVLTRNNPLAPFMQPQIEGISKGLGETAGSFATGEGIATAGLLAVPGGQAAMLAKMGLDAPEQIEQAVKVWNDPKASREDKWKAATGSAVNIAMAAGLAWHMKPETVRAKYDPNQVVDLLKKEPKPPIEVPKAVENAPGHIGEIPALQPAETQAEVPLEADQNRNVFPTEDVNAGATPISSKSVIGVSRVKTDRGIVYSIHYNIDGQDYIGYSKEDSWASHSKYNANKITDLRSWDVIQAEKSKEAKPTVEPPQPAAETPAEPSSQPTLYHGSTNKRSVLKAGTMMTDDPGWAAGYTTKTLLSGQDEFDSGGTVHGHNPDFKNPLIIEGGLHDAEGKLIQLAQVTGKPSSTLQQAAKIVAESTGHDAIVASRNGKTVGAIPLTDVPVHSTVPPRDAVKMAMDQGRHIPDNIRAAYERSNPAAAPPVDAAPPQEPPINADEPADVAPTTEPIGMGGAVPSEFDRSSSTATSIKNATVDAERSKRGLPPAIGAARRSFGAVWDEAMAMIDHDPDVQDRLIDELRDKPRALDDDEDALLLHRQIDLQNEYGKATRDLAQAHDDGRTDDVVRERIRVAGLLDKLTDIYDISRKAGTESGRGLNARKMLANEDYSLAKMTMDMRASNEGRPPTVEETVQVQKMHDRIVETQKKLDEYESRVKELESQKAVDEFIKKSLGEQLEKAMQEAAKQPPAKSAPKSAAAKPAMTLADRIRARKSGQKPGTLHAFGLVESVYDTLLEGVALAVEGGAKLADAISKAISDLKISGDWDEAGFRAEIAKDEAAVLQDDKPEVPLKDRVVVGMKQAIAEGESVTDLQRYVQKLAEQHVRDGIKTREPLVDAVHADLKEVDPNITRRETMDLISGYGDFKKLNMEQTKVELRDLKGQMQQVAKLQDIEAREPIKASGVERAKHSDEHRRLIQQVNEAKKKFGVVVTDPARQLKSALDAIKTRLNNSIKDLEFQISTGKKTIKQRTAPPQDAETVALTARRDALKEQFSSIFGKPELTPEQRVRIATASLEKSIADYERRVKEGDISTQSKASKTPSTPALEALRARRDALKDELQELKDIANPKKSKEEIALQSLKKRLANRTAELKEKTAKGDFTTKKRTPIKFNLDADAMRLKAENEKAKQVFQDALEKNRRANRGKFEKFTRAVANLNRVNILSGVSVIEHLAGAAVENIVSRPVTKATAQLMRFSKELDAIRKKAVYHGGISGASELANLRGIVGSSKALWQKLREGKSTLDWLYSKKNYPKEFLAVVQNVHGAIKEPVRQGIYAESLKLRLDAAEAMGLDPAKDEVLRTALQKEAYDNANADIFMGDNFLTKAIHNNTTGYLRGLKLDSGLAKFTADVLDILFPVVNVSTNIAIRKYRLAVGLGEGAIRYGVAKSRGELANGAEKLTPRDAELITKSLTYGLLGAALAVYAWRNSNQFGGIYVPGKEAPKNKTGPKPGEIAVPGLGTVSHHLLHGPIGGHMNMVADARRLYNKVNDQTGNPWEAGSEAMFFSMYAGLRDIPAFSTVARLGSPYKSAGQKAGELLKNMLIPGIVQDASNKTNEDKPKAKTFTQEIRSGVPGGGFKK